MWLAVNQRRPAMDDPQLDTNLAVTPNHTDDDSAPNTSLGPSATQPPPLYAQGDVGTLAPAPAPAMVPATTVHDGNASLYSPGSRLPACDLCGIRHGEPGMPTTCIPRGAPTRHMPQLCASHPYVAPTTAANAGPHYLGNQQARAPPGMHHGHVTDSQNTCLIHTLMLAWSEDQKSF
jgi:hypothetical protein